jgi:hypothetical protein
LAPTAAAWLLLDGLNRVELYTAGSWALAVRMSRRHRSSPALV